MRNLAFPLIVRCRPFTAALLVIAFAAVARPSAAAPSAANNGEQTYRTRCVSCHGLAGEGVKDKYPHPLVGDRSPAQLAKLIAKTMPEEAPGTCVGAEADAVAAYIHDSFYSPVARARNKPPRVELSRLTVGQYRNSVADLVGAFRPVGKWDDKRGLRGEYFDGRGFRNDKRLIDRLDPEVKFDFGTGAPATEKFDASSFSIRWEGSVLAPDTGDYEFVVRSDHAVRLWVNDARKPLVDAWVKSGKDTEFRGNAYLLAGRAYPVRVEFSKATQGVQDNKKKDKPKPPSVKASVALLWKRPGRSPEVIPAVQLSPAKFPETFAVATPFPADDRSLGWERGTTVSKAWDQAATDAALETAGYVAARRGELAGLKDDAKDAGPRLREFGRRFAERAFRRPLSEEQKRVYVDRQFDAAKDHETAVKRVVLAVLKSPRFLYREAGTGDAYDTATRLSFALWDTLPDDELLKAAAAGKLATREQVAKQAERMLGDQRAKAKVHDFVLRWLKVDQVPDVAKDPKRYPGFDPAVVSDLRTSLDLFVDDVIWAGDVRQLLLSESVYLNGRLAKFYGVDWPADAPFKKATLDPGKRAGVLTHPYLLASFAYTGSTSPIHRGVLLARGLLGISLRPPPEAFAPFAENLHPQLTTRERVALQTKPAACSTCHAIINPLGFALESFDAVGRYREKDNGRPVDAGGSYLTRKGDTKTFTGARELAAFLAGSEEVHAAFAEQLFHHLVKQPVRAYGPKKLDELRAAFAAGGYNVSKLLVEVATTAALPPPRLRTRP